MLCFSLFVGQAFLYNAFFFTYGDTLTTFLGVKQTGWYLAVFAVSNFLGALLLSPLFDTHRPGQDDHRHLRRSPACCSASPASMLGGLNAVTLTMFGAVIFFFASAGASAAYLTASEVFPMETRALCIAFFYAIGTAVGGISGPLLFGKLIDNASASKDITGIAIGYFIGAGADGRRRHRRGLPRRQGRGPVAGEHRPAADRRGRREGRRGSEPVDRLSSTGTPTTRKERTMPMPPPRASTEGRDRRVEEEIAQMLRALHAEGPQTEATLGVRVGAAYWEPGRFAHAVAKALLEGRILRDGYGQLRIPGA